MVGNKCIADAAVTYVLKRFWSRLAVLGHVEGGIHHQFFCSFPQMFCLYCYEGFCRDAEQKPTI